MANYHPTPGHLRTYKPNTLKTLFKKERQKRYDGLNGNPDSYDYRDQELYKTQCELVHKYVLERGRVSQNEICRVYPELRDRIETIIRTLAIDDLVQTVVTYITFVEPVPAIERERRQAHRETLWGRYQESNEALFVGNQAKAEVF